MAPITDYVLAVLEAYPSVKTLKVGQGAIDALDASRLPAGVVAEASEEDYCAGLDEDGGIVVLFRV